MSRQALHLNNDPEAHAILAAVGQLVGATLSDKVFPHQRDLVTWALKRGPLAVAKQTVREGKRFGIDCEFDQTGKSIAPIVVTNYEHLDKFTASLFGGAA
jgi:hypothetical protein